MLCSAFTLDHNNDANPYIRLDRMYKCPHCSDSCYSLWRRVVEPWHGAAACPHCAGQVRRSDKAKAMETVGSQVLAVGIFVPLFLSPWWVSSLLVLGAVATMLVLPDVLFPPVAAEPFGSTADTQRARAHFLLITPVALLALVWMAVHLWGN